MYLSDELYFIINILVFVLKHPIQ